MARSQASPGHSARAAHPLVPDPVARWALPALAVAIAALAHWPALDTFFAQDDIAFIARARGLVPTPWSLARPLSEGVVWRGLLAAFGLDPLPYHVFGFLLQLANTALVYAIGLGLLGHRVAAGAAAVLFGASAIAFTPTHWASSSMVELLVATFTLGAFLLWLRARERDRTGALWLAALLGLAAALSKESSVLLPVALLVAHFRVGAPASRRTLVPQLVVAAAYMVAFAATLRLVHYARSETYAMSPSPLFIAQNFATYLRWLVALGDPVRDTIAAMNPNAWTIGLPVGLALLAALWTQRREPRHPEEVGAVWFLVFLAPVVALKHHTYLYYLYLPWPGLCWLLAGVGLRLTRRTSPALGWALIAGVIGFAGVESTNVRTRETAMNGPFRKDKTMREAMLLGNAVKDLRAAGLGAGDRIAFVNPAPQRHVSMADTTSAGSVHSYLPLEGALRGGDAVRVFFPGVTYLGFDDQVPREWENARIFLFHDEGTLRPVGSGAAALAELGLYAMRIQQYPRADQMFLRSLALGDTLADATYGLIITSDFVGRKQDSQRYAAEFLRRWPNDRRASAVASAMFPQ